MGDGRLPQVTRRTILRRAGILAAAMSASRAPMPMAVGAARRLSLTLSFSDGSSLKFDEAQAIELGEYAGDHVQQKCFRQRRGPWTIFFRPDVHGPRQEIVVEYGSEFVFSLDVAPTPLSS